jgi:hypothetical protein
VVAHSKVSGRTSMIDHKTHVYALDPKAARVSGGRSAAIV